MSENKNPPDPKPKAPAEAPAPPSPAAGPPPSPPVPRGPRVRYLFAIVVVGIAMLIVGANFPGPIKSSLSLITHPDGAREGNMSGHADGAGAASKPATKWWTCGMHPQVMLPKPGDCPICHMALVPYDPAQGAEGEVVISPAISQEIGVRIAEAVTGPVTRSIRTVGTVETDETTVRDLTVKFGGWVEKLHVNYLGEAVQPGQPLFEIYSPDLFTSQQDYLQAYRAATEANTDKSGQWTQDMLTAARKRLENFDISTEQISELEKSGKATRTLTINSPYRGLVIAKNIVEGAKVEPGTQLYRIADLSRVWVVGTLYEYQLPLVKVGQTATMTLPYARGRSFEGKVTYIYPVMNAEARQARMRLEVDNPELQLKPGMYTNIEIQSTVTPSTTPVPREAVIDTGDRKIVFLSLGEGRFVARPVKIGVETEAGMVEVLEGIAPKDKIVTSGQFLLDSEARLAESRAKMIRGTLAAEQKDANAAPAPMAALAAKTPATAPAAAAMLSPAAAQAIQAVLERYLAIWDKLADDSMTGVAEEAKKLAAAAEALPKTPMSNEHFWHMYSQPATIAAKANELAAAKDIAKARELFAQLSPPLIALVKDTGVPQTLGKDLQSLHCSMFGGKGADWLQPAGKARNPFYGKSMLECAEKNDPLPQAAVEKK